MELSLTITGSASAIAAVLAALPDGVNAEGNAAFTHTGTGTPELTPLPVAPTSAAPTQPAPFPDMSAPSTSTPAGSDDEEGDATDGSGLDANGLPWDERIHSGSKKKGKDGTWNKRRGGPSGDQLAAIEAELRGNASPTSLPATATPLSMTPPPMVMQQPMPTVQLQQPVQEYPPVPMPTVPVPTPVQQQQPAAPTVMSYADFMGHVMGQTTKLDGNGQPMIHADYLANLAQEISNAYQMPVPLTAITDLQQHPDKIGYAIQLIQRDNRW